MTQPVPCGRHFVGLKKSKGGGVGSQTMPEGRTIPGVGVGVGTAVGSGVGVVGGAAESDPPHRAKVTAATTHAATATT
jgi:hypothetical protein